MLPVSAMFAVFGTLELVVLFRFLGDLDWSVARAWIYLLFLLIMLALGLSGLYAVRAAPSRLRKGMDDDRQTKVRATPGKSRT